MTLHILDGHAHLYSFKAGPCFAPQKKPADTVLVQAVFGFLRYLKENRPSHAVIVFDCDKKHLLKRKWHPEYKAKRVSAQKAKASSVDMCEVAVRVSRVFDDIGICNKTIKGYEGDDIINSLVLKFSKKKHIEKLGSIYVVTGDKDLMVLAGGRVFWKKHTYGREILGTSDIIKKMGLPPEQLRDYLILCGDSIDDIPGVAKIGDVFAKRLLNEYGSIKAMVESGRTDGLVGHVARAHANGSLRAQIRMVTLLKPKTGVRMKDMPFVLPSIGQAKKALRSQGLSI